MATAAAKPAKKRVVTTWIKKIIGAIQQAGAWVEQAAEYYVEAKTTLDDELGAELDSGLLKAGMTAQGLERLERIGNGQMDVRLFFASGAYISPMLKLTADRQADALDNGIKVYRRCVQKTVVKKPSELTREEVRAVFNDGRIRSPAAQKRFYARMEATQAATVTAAAPIEAEDEKWEIRDGMLYVHAPLTLREVRAAYRTFARQS